MPVDALTITASGVPTWQSFAANVVAGVIELSHTLTSDPFTPIVDYTATLADVTIGDIRTAVDAIAGYTATLAGGTPAGTAGVELVAGEFGRITPGSLTLQRLPA